MNSEAEKCWQACQEIADQLESEALNATILKPLRLSSVADQMVELRWQLKMLHYILTQTVEPTPMTDGCDSLSFPNSGNRQ